PGDGCRGLPRRVGSRWTRAPLQPRAAGPWPHPADGDREALPDALHGRLFRPELAIPARAARAPGTPALAETGGCTAVARRVARDRRRGADPGLVLRAARHGAGARPRQYISRALCDGSWAMVGFCGRFRRDAGRVLGHLRDGRGADRGGPDEHAAIALEQPRHRW